MEVLLVLLTVVVTVASSSSSTTTTTTTTSHLAGHSLLSSLLQVAGFSNTCVAAALDACAPAPQESQFTSLLQEVRDTMKEVTRAINKCESRPRHCKDLLDSGDNVSGQRVIYPYPDQKDRRLTVYCDQTTDAGGWTVFQRRSNTTLRENFYRTWSEYQLGFGHLEGEFWLGLDPLHVLTSTALQELRVDLADYDGGERFAKYGFFHIAESGSKYRLSVGRYSGDAGDCLEEGGHSGARFSTHDADNDSYKSNCAQEFRGAWWYTACHRCNLNGYQHVGNHTSFADGINWYPWRGHHYSLRRTAMMIRPAF